MAPIKRLTVVGAGYMGCQIALQAAAHGIDVRLYDSAASALQASGQTLQGMLAQWRQDAAQSPSDDALDRIRLSDDLESAVGGTELVIEAIREDLASKRELFAELDRHCRPEVLLTSNSSSLRISRIESATERPQRVMNTHFVQPVWKCNFVELMRGTATSDETYATVEAFIVSIGLMPVQVRRENTGFVYNCIWRAVKREALRLVDQGIASVEDVDRTWMIKMGSPLGPFALMDRVGLDVVRDIELVYHEESGDERDAPPQILLDKIAKNELGVKTGQGFYSYPNPDYERWQENPAKPEE